MRPEEDAHVLIEHVQGPGEGGPRAAVDAVRVADGVDVRPGAVDGGVDVEPGRVDGRRGASGSAAAAVVDAEDLARSEVHEEHVRGFEYAEVDA